MTRTVAREIAVQILFAVSGTGDSADEALDSFFDKEYYATLAEENDLYKTMPGKKQMEYIRAVVYGVLEHQSELDEKIEKYAKGWKLKRIPTSPSP
jgi:N utilization substance protein B